MDITDIKDVGYFDVFNTFYDRYQANKNQKGFKRDSELLQCNFELIKDELNFDWDYVGYHTTDLLHGSLILGTQQFETNKDSSVGDSGKFYLSKDPTYFYLFMSQYCEFLTFIIDLRNVKYTKRVRYYDSNENQIKFIDLSYEIDDKVITNSFNIDFFKGVTGIEFFTNQDIPIHKMIGFYYIQGHEVEEVYLNNFDGKTLKRIALKW